MLGYRLRYYLVVIFLSNVYLLLSVPINSIIRDSIVSYLTTEKSDGIYDVYFYNGGNDYIELENGKKYLIKKENVVVFIDLYPFADWHHDCMLVMFDKTGNIVQTFSCDICPSNMSDWIFDLTLSSSILYTENSGSQNWLPAIDEVLVKPHLYEKTSKYSPNSYALILSGGSSSTINRPSYWNDCSSVYQMLTDVYGYPKENIFVLFSDGDSEEADLNIWSSLSMDNLYGPFRFNSPLDLDGDGIDEISMSATKSNVSLVFDILGDKLTPDDDLFVFVTDHGSKNGYISLWNNDSLSVSELSYELDKIHPKYTAMLFLQCYGGQFVEGLKGDNRILMSATATNLLSYSSNVWNERNYNLFGNKWISAMAGYDTYLYDLVNADKNKDGLVSFYEAFEYAKENYSIGHSKAESNPIFWCNNNYENFALGNTDITHSHISNTIVTSDLETEKILIYDIKGNIIKVFSNGGYSDLCLKYGIYMVERHYKNGSVEVKRILVK